MGSSDITEPKVFIIESLKFEDEVSNYYEGQLISKILTMSDIEHKYFYIRTEKELKVLLGQFYDLKYRYLHISCHGNSSSIGTTLDSISFSRLADLLETNLYKKRLFLSACKSANKNLANAIFKKTGCFSLIGSNKTINIDDAAIFWASFYQLMFKKSSKSMNRDTLTPTLRKLAEVHELPIKYFTAKHSNESGWEEVKLK